MEIFCDKCGSLISGSSKFCPLCGKKIGNDFGVSATLNVDTSSDFLDSLDNSKLDIDTGSDFLDNLDTSSFDTGAADDVLATPTTVVPVPVEASPKAAEKPVAQKQNNTAGNAPYVPMYANKQNFSCKAPTEEVEKLTTTQWLGTIVLFTCLGPISFVMLIMNAFNTNVPEPKKSFARALLIALPILSFSLTFLFGVVGAIAEW